MDRRVAWTTLALLAALGCGGGAPQPAPESVTVRGDDDFAFVAGPDDAGAWTVLSPTAGTYTLQLTGERYGIAFACPTATTISINVIFATVAKGSEVDIDCAAGPTGEPPGVETLVMVGGTVSGPAAELDGREERSTQRLGRITL